MPRLPHPTRPAAVLSLAAVLSGVLPAPLARGETENGFQPLRPPLFGLAIEQHTTDDVFRLVRIDELSEDKTTLIRGALSDCERELVAVLTRRYGGAKPNIPFHTLGGKQFWADEFVYCGWRIQRNVYTGHSRLLDADDVRQGWGDYRQCRIEFERLRSEERLRPRSDHLVLLVHGLFRSKDSFRHMEAALERRGFEVEAINYPSTRHAIGEHAEQLETILNALEDSTTVSFVTHSLGGIVVRELLARPGAWKKRLKVHRLVMLGPPNRGSVVADVLKDWLPYRVLAGKAATQLTPEEVDDVPQPTCPVGIIAGGTGTARGLNPLLPGDNDGTVLVENTRLDGVDDFLVVRCLHSFLMNDERVIEATERFLKEGKFRP